MTDSSGGGDAWSVDGKTCLITGGSRGIGRETALALGRRGAHVVVAARSEEGARSVVDEIVSGGGTAEYLAIDLASLEAVRRSAETFVETDRPLHVLINNAGVSNRNEMSVDGFELSFAVNHLGHFLLTRLLVDRLTESSPARIVTVASDAHYRAQGITWRDLRRKPGLFGEFRAYQTSKLCNVLFAVELSRRLPEGVTATALHPGMVDTDIWRSLPRPFRPLFRRVLISPEEGSRTSVWCASEPGLHDESGGYFVECRRKQPSRVALDPDLAADLWERSEVWTSGSGEP